jgi:ABC-type hemin transport system ATPase subunit
MDGARRPAALLLDEPTTSLDVSHQVGMLQGLRELATEGSAVMAVLRSGRPLAYGSSAVAQ